MLNNPFKVSLITTFIILIFISCLHKSPSDASLRRRVVKLTSSKGQCSGEQIRTKLGVDYVLTVAHCRDLEENGFIHVTSEDGNEYNSRVIEKDTNSDLLLLEGIPGVKGISIARHAYRFDEIRTFTHGSDFPTYKTKGSLIGEITRRMPSDDFNLKKYTPPKIENFIITDAFVAPGSSGGMVVNDSGELMGVVSARDSNNFAYLVSLKDIHNFLSKY